jgi:hypothetical protein
MFPRGLFALSDRRNTLGDTGPARDSGPMGDRGLNPDGTIAREGSLDRVTARFAPVVAAARAEIAGRFSDGRLHGAYLYGSIPRGTAVPGASDLCTTSRPPGPGRTPTPPRPCSTDRST